MRLAVLVVDGHLGGGGVEADSEGGDEVGGGTGGELFEGPGVGFDLFVEIEPAACQRLQGVAHRHVRVGQVVGCCFEVGAGDDELVLAE